MAETSPPPQQRAAWEEEVLARHRWGRHGERAGREHARLAELWRRAEPLDTDAEAVLAQVIALEICNWDLEESIVALCEAIGAKRPAARAVGHMASISPQRWRRVWAYYLSLRNWLPRGAAGGYDAALDVVDPGGEVRQHVLGLLGERNELKELYVERLCLCLSFWLGGYFPSGCPQRRAHDAAVVALEEPIRQHDPDGGTLRAVKDEGDGRLQPCSHKAFRRYDIILSSIGAGAWRGAMPRRGTDGFERADTLERYLAPIEAWTRGEAPEGRLGQGIHARLGKADDTKAFLASVLASLLRAQQLAAEKRAQKRAEGAG
jgi:hypothetical protein